MSKSKLRAHGEYDPWSAAIAESLRDWWMDYERLASVSCMAGCGTFSQNVAEMHKRRTGHAVRFAAAMVGRAVAA